jgi:hypothetical protein
MISDVEQCNQQASCIGSWTAASPSAISGILTLLSKCFSTFPHGTCLLSISRQYIVVDGGYHPFCALLPKSVTQWNKAVLAMIRDKNRAVTFFGVPFQASYSRSPNSQISDAQLHQRWINISDFSHFVRHYYGNPSWFLFLRLIICLNSAGNLVWARITISKMPTTSLSSLLTELNR